MMMVLASMGGNLQNYSRIVKHVFSNPPINVRKLILLKKRNMKLKPTIDFVFKKCNLAQRIKFERKRTEIETTEEITVQPVSLAFLLRLKLVKRKLAKLVFLLKPKKQKS